jgi:hypothetical protein
MFRVFRTVPAALAVASLLLAAAPARADLDSIDKNSVPVMVDLLLLRPMGLAVTAVGVAAFVPAGLMTALFRPSEIDKPFDLLVKQPFGYTFQDPLGTH